MGICACLALALALLVPATGSAAVPAAQEQYVLDYSGVGKSEVGTSDPIVARAQRAGPVGVVGEDEGAVTQLAAVTSAITAPAGIAIVVVLAGGVGVALFLRRREPSR